MGLERFARQLGTAAVLTPELLELRRVYAAALNSGVAKRCRAALGAGGQQGGLAAELDRLEPRLANSSWTTPQLAFAYHVRLGDGAAEPAYLAATLACLAEPLRSKPPPVRLAYRPEDEPWVSYAVAVFEGDRRRDRCDSTMAAVEPTDAERDTVRRALELLEDAWPEMAGAVHALARQVVWLRTLRGTGARSATLIQAFGALFLAPRTDVITTVEDLVHETTHLDLVMRLAVDKLIRNGAERGRSPFRQEKRPLTRVLHSAVVAARSAEALDRSAGLLRGGERDACQAGRAQAEANLATALETLRAKAHCTAAGAALLDELGERASLGAAH